MDIIHTVDDRATSTQAASHREQGGARPQSAEHAVAAVEQRRLAALLTADMHALDEIIDEPCTHLESNGTARTKAAFLADVAPRALSFDLFEIDENHIRICGETAVVAGTYRTIARVRGAPTPVKHAHHLRVSVNRGGRWTLVAHQATAIAPRSH
jgi:Domain of unknown function (DUF4440)